MYQLVWRRFAVVALAIASLGSLTPSANAGFIQSTLDLRSAPPLSGNSLSFTTIGLVVDGVTFDATVNVTGSADVNSNNNGLGVDGSTSTLINAGEWLKLSMTISNVSGGSVAFDGFAGVALRNFENDDLGVVSSDVAGVFVLASLVAPSVDFSLSPLVTSIYVIGQPPVATGTTSFRLEKIVAQFSSVAPVPEPATGTLLLSGLVMIAGYRSRRGW